MATSKNYYVVVKGRTPGIYNVEGPNGAEAQVKGFSNAVFQGSAALEEARSCFYQMTQEQRSATPILPLLLLSKSPACRATKDSSTGSA